MTALDTEATFAQLVEPLRGELTAHCYRMMGSVHDAEDLVQETYLRAWRAFHGFEQRSSVRTWMYRIATNTCLTALEGRSRRPMPTGLGQPASDPNGALDNRPEVGWLEPLPDAVVWGKPTDDPADQVVSRESVRLAFVAALQHLTPLQRAVLILRDVLAWPAAQVAEALDVSVAAANSALQRARAHVETMVPEEDQLVDDHARELLDGYVAAFEHYDVDRIVELLTADATWEMPPYAGWYEGASAIGTLIRNNCPAQRAGDMRLVATAANGQPAFGMYMRDLDGVHRAFQLQVVSLRDGQVSHVAAFFDVSLFDAFGLPREFPADHS
ncbi:sigma-70 family RNA polymerase sigma factor [Microlunatus ginsengisoli]|uniref:Sigma-70 family RNA polymerase sigma factor n=1 Tax=Microlunatus ginsengisoli TaxID=363863 RepID=A0ABP6ZZQ5_9ACTN